MWLRKLRNCPKPFFLRWKDSVINKYPADTWAYISIASFRIVPFVAWVAFFFSKTVAIKRRLISGLVFWPSCLSGFAVSHAAQQKARINNRNTAIVFCPRVTVKSSPSETGTDLFLIYEGLKLEITDQLDSWTEIKLADGNQGWLPDSCIVRI